MIVDVGGRRKGGRRSRKKRLTKAEKERGKNLLSLSHPHPPLFPYSAEG